MRILHLTDTHLFGKADGELRGVVTGQSLRRVLQHYGDSGWTANQVLVTGDIANDEPAAYMRFVDALLPLALPVACLPGNHDNPHHLSAACAAAGFGYCAEWSADDWLVIGLDSTVPGRVCGELGEPERRRLEQALAQHRTAHALVCLHHPPVALGSTWLDRVGLQDGTAFLDLLAGYPCVRAVLFGHAHQAFDALHGELRVLGTPSTCRQFLPGSEAFAIGSEPPGYRRLELHADGRIDSDVVWVHED